MCVKCAASSKIQRSTYSTAALQRCYSGATQRCDQTCAEEARRLPSSLQSLKQSHELCVVVGAVVLLSVLLSASWRDVGRPNSGGRRRRPLRGMGRGKRRQHPARKQPLGRLTEPSGQHDGALVPVGKASRQGK